MTIFYRREAFGKENPQLYWNSRKIPDAIIRARLGGWTSEHDMRRQKTVPIIDQHRVEDIYPVSFWKVKNKFIELFFVFKNKKLIVTREERDELAQKYQWTSSTQKCGFS
jgi:hypothetical protein